MCCPGDQISCPEDRFLSHRILSQAFVNYISITPALRCRSPVEPTGFPPPPKQLDVYITRVIHASQVPGKVAYAALYLLASISKSCNCRTPHDDNEFDDSRLSPARFSHVLSRAVTRTPFSRISKSHWSEKHIFMGAFCIALLAYMSILSDEEAAAMQCWNIMPSVSGISCKELGEIATAFKQCVDCNLQTTLEKMLWSNRMRSLGDVICPFTIAGSGRSSKMVEDGKEKGQKRRMSLKRSVSSFWRSPEETTLVTKESEPELQSQPASRF